jgi:TolB-like protein
MKPVLLFLFLFSLQSFSAETIALSPLKSNGVTEGEAASLTDALRSELSKAGKYDVMERNQMDQILKEQGFQQSGACDEASCAVEIGKMLAVKYIILGNVGKVGKTYTMSVRMVDISTGKIVRDITEYHKGETDELLTDVIPVVAKKITGTMAAAPAKKSNNAWVWWTSGCVVVAAAIAVPTYILLNSKRSSTSSMDVTTSW